MRELILRGLHLFFLSLSFGISLSLPSDFLCAPSSSLAYSLYLTLAMCFPALIPLVTIIHFYNPPPPRCPFHFEFPLSPILPPLLAGFMGLWCMVISQQTHLSAHSLSSFGTFLIFSLVARRGLWAVWRCSRNVYIWLVRTQQSEMYRQRSRRGRNGKTESKIAEQKNKDELQKGAQNTKSKHNTPMKANTQWTWIQINSMSGLCAGIFLISVHQRTTLLSFGFDLVVHFVCNKKHLGHKVLLSWKSTAGGFIVAGLVDQAKPVISYWGITLYILHHLTPLTKKAISSHLENAIFSW